MSRKPSRGTPGGLDFRAPRGGGPITWTTHDSITQAIADARAAGISEERIALSLLRARMIAEQQQRKRATPAAPARTRGRGRPASGKLDVAAADYLFDVEHYDWLRELGVGHVPPDRDALDAAIARHFPEDDPNDGALRERRRGALKQAVARRKSRT